MGRLVGEYAKSVREQLGLRRVDVAERMGLWKHRDKGGRRLEAFEADGSGRRPVFDRLCAVLALDAGRLAELRAVEERQYQAWMDEPVPMVLTVRIMACVYQTRRVPEGLDRYAALVWAVGQARAEGRAMCLRVSRRERIWIERGGTSYSADLVRRGTEHLPAMMMGGQAFTLKRTE